MGLKLWCTLGQSWETSQPPMQFSSAVSAMVWEQSNTHSSWAESRLPTVLLLVPLAHQPAKGAHLVCVEHRDWGSLYVP